MSKSKLLIVGAFPQKGKVVYGGIAKSCQVLLKSSIASRFEIITLDSTQLSNPPPGLVIRGLLAIRRLFLLTFRTAKHKPNASLIFVSGGYGGAIEKGLMILVCKLLGSKTLIFPRAEYLIDIVSSSYIKLKSIELLFGSSDIFLCQGEKWKEFAVSKLNMDQSRVKILHNWTATETKIRIGKNRDFSAGNTVPKVIFVGWLEEYKGVLELLEASNNLHIEGINFHLTFIGGGGAENYAKEYITKNELDDCVTLSGWANSSELNNFLAESDIFVLPSWSEGLPNAMIEAMAAKLAVVVTSVGVITDYIQNEKHALIVPPRNVELLEESLKKLIINIDLRTSIALEGHSLAVTSFSVESNMTILGDVIEDLIENSRNGIAGSKKGPSKLTQ